MEGRDFAELHGGKGSNQAVACGRLGADVAFLACVGTDAGGDAATALYHQEGVDSTAVIRHSTLPTGVAFIIVDDSGENPSLTSGPTGGCSRPTWNATGR